MNPRAGNAGNQNHWISTIKSNVKRESIQVANIEDKNSISVRPYLTPYSLFAPNNQLATTFSEVMWHRAIRGNLKF